MAKRKRLTPVITPPASGPPETKAYKNGWAGTQVHSGAPIADVAGSAATAAALDELAHEIQSARTGGRLVISADLDRIDERYIVRDRAVLDPEEMETLKTSLRTRGQQTPIEVVDLGGEQLGLISGWRRLTALKALHQENPEGGFGQIQCLIRRPDAASDAYVAMVEENEIRAPLKLYERARIAILAAEQGVFSTPREAAKALFGSIPRAKRSKIYSFFAIYEALDQVLQFPEALSERQGLAIAKVLDQDAKGFVARVKAQKPAPTAEDERVMLEQILTSGSAAKPARKPAKQTLSQPDGVSISRRNGEIILSGKGVTPALEADLKVWLASRN